MKSPAALPTRSAPDADASLVVTVAEACGLLRISRSFVWKLIAKGQIRTLKIGRRTLIKRSELDKLLDDQAA